MIKKIFYTLTIFLFLTSCGYQPLISKNTNFTLKLIELGGNTKVNYIIKNKLKIYEEENSKYDLEILNSEINKIVTSMDTKGNPKTFQMTIKLIINLNKNPDFVIEGKSFATKTNYNTISSKFDLKKYEDNLIENLTQKILDELILYIQTL